MRCLPVYLPLGLLAACGGPDMATLVPELRVMAILPDQPELAPGASTNATVRVLDPAGDGADVWVWTCTPFEGGCLGDPAPPTPTPIGDGRVVTSVTVSPALAAVATETPTPLVLMWALACVPGVCDDFFDDPAALADPLTRMKDIPIAGTSLASWRLLVSTRAEPHTNPTLTGPADLANLDAWTFLTSTDAATAFSYTTAGGFEEGRVTPIGGQFMMKYLPPEEPPEGPTDLLVLLIDPEGGIASWDARLE
jgi:hypothetical protein